MTKPTLLKSLTDATLDEIVWSSDKTVLVDFHAEWCGACPSMMQLLAGVEDSYPTIDFRSCDADANARCANELGVRSLPFLALIHQGTVIATHQGMAPRSVITYWLSTLVEAHNLG